VAETEAAINLLRQAGFKIHGHWMPNLYGSDPDADIHDFDQLFTNPSICPDELKIYPCSLIDHTELMNIHQRGLWQPYTRDQLVTVLTHALTHTPEYCRLTRIIRDIPGHEIVTGNKTTNLRQLIESNINPIDLHDIRAREIRNSTLTPSELILNQIEYHTAVSTEYFLQFITADRRIAAFLRLSFPTIPNPISELSHKAIIREVHVYGQSISVGDNNPKRPQHSGLGKKLITQSVNLAKKHGYSGISVISAIGTREYYKKLGFTLTDLYQHLSF
jgi:elongator complex protein 3